eukprot:TRINITY_DN9880_c0_g1_i2.p1 TRINITY_DN9880_c0_g1~~TRINITY_DN9880_c0_g1_i2.p1  ORF type:complete len:234 (-),score=45.96 TRINITY_DN9880_c0_g1_i2:459-1160(-)
MNDRERAVNQDLQILGDAYRLGQIQREEYRARRRHVLAGLRSSNDVDTTRKPLKGSNSETVRAHVPLSGSRTISGPLSPAAAAERARPAMASAAPAARSVAWKYWLLFGIGLLVVAVAVALLLKSPDEEPKLSAAPAAVVDPLAELEASASRFTDRDDWQKPAIEAWIASWQGADVAVRRTALGRPALQQLRDQATYNLSVRKALAAPEAGADPAATGTEAIERLLQALDQST